MKNSRIPPRENERFIQIREDYLHLVDGDACAAAMLALFEFWTNGKAEHVADDAEIWITGKTAQDISDRLLNLYNEKSVRERLKKLGALGFIQTRPTVKHRKTLDYLLCETRLTQALQELRANLPTVKAAKANGKNAAGSQKVKTPLVDERPNGKNTADPTVKTPLETVEANGKNAVALYIRNSSLLEERKEEGEPPNPVPQTPTPTQELFVEEKEEEWYVPPTTQVDQEKKDAPDTTTPDILTPVPCDPSPSPAPRPAPAPSSDVQRFESVLSRRSASDEWQTRDAKGKLVWHPEFVEYYRQHLSNTPHYFKTLGRPAKDSDAMLSLTQLKRTEEGKDMIAIHGQAWLDKRATDAAREQAAVEREAILQAERVSLRVVEVEEQPEQMLIPRRPIRLTAHVSQQLRGQRRA